MQRWLYIVTLLVAVSAAATTCAQQAEAWEPYNGSAEPYQVTGDPWTEPLPTAPDGVYAGSVQIFDAPGVPIQESAPAVAYPDGQTEPEPIPLSSKALMVPGSRKSFFQKINFVGTYMPAMDDDGLGVTHLQTSVGFAVPFFTRKSPLLITPGYGVRFLDGPTTLDIPSRLHDAEVDFSHFRPLSERWLLNPGVGIGHYADDASFGESDAWRASGRALGIYMFNPQWKGIIGVVYVNRADWSVLPAVGLQYDTPDVKYDLVFPRPRAAYRVWNEGDPGMNERWVYAAAEFGGGIWTVQRANGVSDELSARDYRLLIGTERKVVGGVTRRFEIGYVFGRTLEYSSGAEIDVDDTLLARIALTY